MPNERLRQCEALARRRLARDGAILVRPRRTADQPHGCRRRLTRDRILSAPMDGYRRYAHRDKRGKCYLVDTRGTGPPVIVIHEMAGISPMLLAFADRLVRAGFSVHLPQLIRRRRRFPMLAASIEVCISSEFTKLAWGRTSPVVTWLRSLAAAICDKRHHNVGVVGMCLTGGFALAMAVDPIVVAPVVAHPSLPLGIGSRRRRDLGLDSDHLTALRERTNLRIFGVRFSADVVAPAPRFDRMQTEFGTRFVRREVVSGACSPHGLSRWEHSVLCSPRLCSDEADDATAQAELDSVVQDVIAFLKSELMSFDDHGAQPSPEG